MTPYNYAKNCYMNGKSASMLVMNAGGRFLICDGDWNILKTKVSYATSAEALHEITKVLDKTRKFIGA